jgi:hypothetical protein
MSGNLTPFDSPSITVAMRAVNTSTPSIPNSTVTTVTGWNASKLDTHNAFNVTTGEYVIPVPGIYTISTSFLFTGDSWAANSLVDTVIRKNGADLANTRAFVYSAITTNIPAPLDITTARFEKGDKITIHIYQTSGAAKTIYISSSWNFLSIIREGN